MPRPMWSGAVSFGLVTIPVKLYSAVSRKNVSFNQIDRKTGSRIKYKKVSAADGSEVLKDDIVKGHELGDGRFITITPEELSALDPKASRTIDIVEFVDLDEIDPVFYDSAYVLAPDPDLIKPYALLAQALEQANKVGIARFVMRNKQYLCAIRPADGKLVLSTMVYADELVDTEAIPEFDDYDSFEIDERELDMAQQLIATLTGQFEPEKFHDTHRQQVQELIEAKSAGQEITYETATPDAERVVDLMAALEASVAAAKEARKGHPTATDGADGAADESPVAQTA